MKTTKTLLQHENETLRNDLATAWAETEKAYATKAESDATIHQLQQQITSLKSAPVVQPPKVSTPTMHHVTPDPEDHLVKMLKTANGVLSDTLRTVSLIARSTQRQERLRTTTMPMVIAGIALVVGIVIWSPWNGRTAQTHVASLPSSHQSQPTLQVAFASDEPSMITPTHTATADSTVASSGDDEPRESLDVTIHRGLIVHHAAIVSALLKRAEALADNRSAFGPVVTIRANWETVSQLYRLATPDDQAVVQAWATTLDESFTTHQRFPSHWFINKL